METNKILPQAIDLEEAVLSAMLIDSDAVIDVSEILKPEVFYRSINGLIFKAILEVHKNSTAELLSVSEYLKKTGKLELIGGDTYLIKLTQIVASTANVEFHARLLLEKYIKREIIKQSGIAIDKSYSDDVDVFDLIDNSYNSLNEITEFISQKQEKSFGNIVESVIERGIDLYLGKVEAGIPTPIKNMTESMGGWRNGELIYIAGRPSMGKTAYVLKTALDTAKNGMPVAFFSLETSENLLVSRLLSMEYRISNDNFIRKGITQADHDKLEDKRLNEIPLFIDDTANLSIEQLQLKAKRLKSKHDIKLLIIDYIQLMSGKNKGSREQEISKISRGLKIIAKELNIPVIALSQLSRSVETRGGAKRPLLSDLRESGSLEQDADVVMFLYRPEYYGIIEWDDYDRGSTVGEAEYIVSKNKNGSLIRNRMKFEGKYTLFSDIDESDNFDINAEINSDKFITPSKDKVVPF